VIAIDTNILVYAHRADSQWHDAAYALIKKQAEGASIWAIPWPCLHEFLAIVTHPRIYSPPTPLTRALSQIDAWVESPSLILLGESEGYWNELKNVVSNGKISGAQVHDARIAALCRFHGIDELWTADRDFNRFPGLFIKNPLVR
jgi:toxin-antitoxin system PIN domain toxin